MGVDRERHTLRLGVFVLAIESLTRCWKSQADQTSGLDSGFMHISESVSLLLAGRRYNRDDCGALVPGHLQSRADLHIFYVIFTQRGVLNTSTVCGATSDASPKRCILYSDAKSQYELTIHAWNRCSFTKNPNSTGGDLAVGCRL